MNEESRPGRGGGSSNGFKDQRTPSGPVVRAVVAVDLRRHVDGHGQLTDEGELAAWSVLAGLSPGRDVRLQIGSCQWVTERFRELLAEYLCDAGSVVIEGTRERAIDALTAVLSVRPPQGGRAA